MNNKRNACPSCSAAAPQSVTSEPFFRKALRKARRYSLFLSFPPSAPFACRIATIAQQAVLSHERTRKARQGTAKADPNSSQHRRRRGRPTTTKRTTHKNATNKINTKHLHAQDVHVVREVLHREHVREFHLRSGHQVELLRRGHHQSAPCLPREDYHCLHGHSGFAPSMARGTAEGAVGMVGGTAAI